MASAADFRQSYQAALQKNETIFQSLEAVEQADEKVNQSIGAVLPNVSLEASHARQDKSENPFGQQFSPSTQDSAQIKVSQPIFKGLAEVAALKGFKRARESSEFLALQARVSLYQQVATSYYNVLGFEQDLRNLKEQVVLYDQRVKDLQRRTRRGESNVTEALTAQSALASLEADIQLVTGKLQAAREDYAFLTGLPSDSVLVDEAAKNFQSTKPLLPLEQYLARVEQRPDILSAIKLAKAAEEQVKATKRGHWPTLDASGNYYLKRPVAFFEDIDWDVQLTLKFPIFEGGTRQSKVREVASQRRVTDLELAKKRREAVKQIRSLYESLKVRLNQVAALEKTVGLAEQNYKAFQRELRNGLVNSVTAQIALTEFRIARRTYDQARYAAQTDLITLEAASFMVPADVSGKAEM